jgi:hypothetical protein
LGEAFFFYVVKQEQLEHFYNTLGHQFIAGGNYDAKHTDWGSRLFTPKGFELLKTMERNNLKYISVEDPTYWLSDRNKLSDLMDFFVTKGIPQEFAVAKSCFYPSSNHSSVLSTLTAHALKQEK